MIVANVASRFLDLSTLSKFVEEQLDNRNGGVWEKFYGLTGTETVPEKPTDYDPLDRDAVAAVFDKAEAVEQYKEGYTVTTGAAGEPVFESAGKVISGKRQSDMLASMQQGSIMRHMTRLRAICAAQSRRAALGDHDIQTLMQTQLDKWAEG
jgi:hypothetical protein